MRHALAPILCSLIERNNNKNVVQDDVQLMENNDLRQPSPVVTYLVLANGRQEKLNFIHRKYAYGIDSQDKLEKKKFRILLVVLKDRETIVGGEIVDPIILENQQLTRVGQGINFRRTRS
jgi:hypothetical protein